PPPAAQAHGPPAGGAPLPSNGKLRVGDESYLLRSGSALTPLKQPRARRSRQGTDPTGSLLLPLRGRLQYLRPQPPRRRTGDGLGEPVPDPEAAAEDQRAEERGGATGGAQIPRVQCAAGTHGKEFIMD